MTGRPGQPTSFFTRRTWSRHPRRMPACRSRGSGQPGHVPSFSVESPLLPVTSRPWKVTGAVNDDGGGGGVISESLIRVAHHATYPSHPSESLLRVACPSRLSGSLIRVAHPSQIFESHIRVAFPSRTSESLIRVSHRVPYLSRTSESLIRVARVGGGGPQPVGARRAA